MHTLKNRKPVKVERLRHASCKTELISIWGQAPNYCPHHDCRYQVEFHEIELLVEEYVPDLSRYAYADA